MNFCPNCGTDLRNTPNIKFCFNCGTGLSSEEVVVNFASYTQYRNDEVENVVFFDDFDYFDFPDSENHFDQFLTFVDEHIAVTKGLTKKEVAEKYFEQGKLMFSLTFEEWDVFQKKEHHDVDLEGLVDTAINCYKACLYFDSGYIDSFFQLAACHHFRRNYNKAFSMLLTYAHQNKEKFGMRSNETSKAASFCLNYPYLTDDNLPYWIKDESSDLPI